jgi:hypothetical protein
MLAIDLADLPLTWPCHGMTFHPFERLGHLALCTNRFPYGSGIILQKFQELLRFQRNTPSSHSARPDRNQLGAWIRGVCIDVEPACRTTGLHPVGMIQWGIIFSGVPSATEWGCKIIGIFLLNSNLFG